MCGRTWTLSVRPVWEETCACAVRRSGGSAEPPGLVLKTKLYLLLGPRGAGEGEAAAPPWVKVCYG